MKVFSWVCCFVLLFSSAAFAQQQSTDELPALVITTSKSTLTLPALNKDSSQNMLRQANAIAQIALKETSGDVDALAKQETALRKDIAAYEVLKKNEESAYAPLKLKYDTRLAAYETALKPLDADIAAFNSSDRLNKELHAQLAVRKTASDNEYSSLKVELGALDNSRNAALARLKAVSDPLQERITKLDFKKGLAYRQLKSCVDYATTIQSMLKVRFNQQEVYSLQLNGAMERLKAMGGKGFD